MNLDVNCIVPKRWVRVVYRSEIMRDSGMEKKKKEIGTYFKRSEDVGMNSRDQPKTVTNNWYQSGSMLKDSRRLLYIGKLNVKVDGTRLREKTLKWYILIYHWTVLTLSRGLQPVEAPSLPPFFYHQGFEYIIISVRRTPVQLEKDPGLSSYMFDAKSKSFWS